MRCLARQALPVLFQERFSRHGPPRGTLIALVTPHAAFQHAGQQTRDTCLLPSGFESDPAGNVFSEGDGNDSRMAFHDANILLRRTRVNDRADDLADGGRPFSAPGPVRLRPEGAVRVRFVLAEHSVGDGGTSCAECFRSPAIHRPPRQPKWLPPCGPCASAGPRPNPQGLFPPLRKGRERRHHRGARPKGQAETRQRSDQAGKSGR